MIICADEYTSLGTTSLPSHFFAAGGERGGGHAEEQRLDIGKQAQAH